MFVAEKVLLLLVISLSAYMDKKKQLHQLQIVGWNYSLIPKLEVVKWIIYLIQHFTERVITYPWRDWS